MPLLLTTATALQLSPNCECVCICLRIIISISLYLLLLYFTNAMMRYRFCSNTRLNYIYFFASLYVIYLLETFFSSSYIFNRFLFSFHFSFYFSYLYIWFLIWSFYLFDLNLLTIFYLFVCASERVSEFELVYVCLCKAAFLSNEW